VDRCPNTSNNAFTFNVIEDSDMNTSTLSALLGSLALLTVMPAHALGVSTNTQLKCFYKTSTATNDPRHDYVWGRDPNSSLGLPYRIAGNWWKDTFVDYKNLFLTNTTQDTLKSVCTYSLTKKGITQPLEMMAAADSPTTLNYTIWTNDSAFPSTKINKVIVFGDSVSDTMNMYNATHWVVPNVNSYFLGHFTNGKVWNEYLTDALAMPNYNWAVGGAAADDYYVVPGLTSQVQTHLNFAASAPNYKPANSLYTVLIGANDLISYGKTPDQIIATEQTALENLITSGARNILMLNLPDLSASPKFSAAMGFKTDAERQALHDNVLLLNQKLITLRDTLQAKYGATLKIKLFETKPIVDSILANGASYGFTNTTESCLDINKDSTTNYATSFSPRAGCTNADTYAFWDILHPSTRSHKIIADQVIPFVKANFPVQ
jgi:thermolabile hemolysin